MSEQSPDQVTMAKAAAILGVDSGGDGAVLDELLVTVTGPSGSRLARVPGRVPLAELSAELAALADVAVVETISVRGLGRLSPRETLVDLHVKPAATLLVNVDERAPAVPPTGGMGGPARPARLDGRRARPRRRLAAAMAAGLVVGLVVGWLVFSSSSTATGPPPAGLAAVYAWLTGQPAPVGRLSGVDDTFGRHGPPIAAQVEPAGWSQQGGLVSEQFLAARSGQAPFGLSVFLDNGKVAYDLAVVALPFVTPTNPSAPAVVPQDSRGAVPPATGLQGWATRAFGPGSPLAGAGFGLAGPPVALQGWRVPPGGPTATATRVRVRLSSAAPGTPGAAAAAKQTGTANQLAADQQALSRAQAQATQAQNNANTAINAAAAAVPPNPLLAAAASQAQAAASAAGQQVNAATAAVAHDRQVLAGLPPAASTPVTVTGVYDVSFDKAGRPVAWAPAGYGTGVQR